MNKTIEKKVKIPWIVFDSELPVPKEITEKTKKVSGEYIRNFYGRLSKYETTKKYEARRTKILSTPLP
ncbi:MAG: hypothetical protein ACOC3Z_01165 [Nanoarchaeota archaeon]